MCRLLGVSTSGYYDCLKLQPCPQQIRRWAITQAAARNYFESHRIYGYRKVYRDLQVENILCCEETVRRVMRLSRIKRKFEVTTNADHILPITENLLNRDFTAAAPNQYGWLISPIFRRNKAGFIWRWCWICSFGESLAGSRATRLTRS